MKYKYIDIKNNYTTLWNTVKITQDPGYNVDQILKNKEKYESINIIPWDVIGCIHMLETSFKFTTHLHNGDPLSARTVQVPAGRPKIGNPPFTWEYSAKDALSDKEKPSEWSIEGKLWFLEAYNGWGYRQYRNINSPYLWSYTNHYTSGKYVRDGKWDPNAVSKQCGAAAVLKRLEEKGVISNSTNFTPPHVTTIIPPVTNGVSNPVVTPNPKVNNSTPSTLTDLIISFLNIFK